jgi:hypothetical protein
LFPTTTIFTSPDIRPNLQQGCRDNSAFMIGTVFHLNSPYSDRANPAATAPWRLFTFINLSFAGAQR